MTIKLMKNEQLQCKHRKVHCQMYNKKQDILKILCPQARRHSSIFHTFEALGLGWPGGAGDDLGMVWGGLGWPGVPWWVAWHDFCIRFVSGFHSWLARAGLMIQ